MPKSKKSVKTKIKSSTPKRNVKRTHATGVKGTKGSKRVKAVKQTPRRSERVKTPKRAQLEKELRALETDYNHHTHVSQCVKLSERISEKFKNDFCYKEVKLGKLQLPWGKYNVQMTIMADFNIELFHFENKVSTEKAVAVVKSMQNEPEKYQVIDYTGDQSGVTGLLVGAIHPESALNSKKLCSRKKPSIFTIQYAITGAGHMQIVAYFPETQTLEFFDPAGKIPFGDEIPKKTAEFFRKFIPVDTIAVYKVPIQVDEDDDYCQTWIWLWTIYRVKIFPDIKPTTWMAVFNALNPQLKRSLIVSFLESVKRGDSALKIISTQQWLIDAFNDAINDK
jgi:hypothetical protein